MVVLWGVAGPCAWALTPGVPVRLAPVKRAPERAEMSALGRVRSVGQVTLTVPVTGRVVGPFPPPGTVTAGQLIARIQPAGLQAEIAAARAQAVDAEETLQRDRRLLRDGVIARAVLQGGRAEAAVAQANLRALEAREAEQALRAPFTGSIDYQIAPGTVVAAGTPVATLSGRGRPWLEVMLPPFEAARLHLGDRVGLKTGSWKGWGRVRSVGQSARRSGLVDVMVALPRGNSLLPGEWVTADFRRSGPASWVVPQAAIVQQGAQTLVYVDVRGRAQPVGVRVRSTRAGYAWVLGPLQRGERVVVEGAGRLVPGSRLGGPP